VDAFNSMHGTLFNFIADVNKVSTSTVYHQLDGMAVDYPLEVDFYTLRKNNEYQNLAMKYVQKDSTWFGSNLKEIILNHNFYLLKEQIGGSSCFQQQ